MFHFDKNKTYRMPVFFGGNDFDSNYEATAFNATIITFTQRCNSNILSNYLPSRFTLSRPELIIQYLQLRDVNFLAGGRYNIFQVSIPVRFDGKEDCVEGILPLVIWENNTIPILGGREESGMPKIYADIDDLNIIDGYHFSTVSYQGNTFFKFDISNLRKYDSDEVEYLQHSCNNINSLGIRYIPKVGQPGADLIQKISYPSRMEVYEAYEGIGGYTWTELPIARSINHYNIIKQIANIPPIYISNPTLIKGKVIMKPLDCHVIN